ncbi:histone-lysine N-methyltransferase PRDM16 [Cylas formicarius]|uniref:histone-lysine N-methyltransferase PRDM16 n=1 Tax=Cylas formicarius TaxID=197179 RepID=UPI0029583722|nr:histone-lysine N-methyltransferase PRDM16 [Cylas formicarius]
MDQQPASCSAPLSQEQLLNCCKPDRQTLSDCCALIANIEQSQLIAGFKHQEKVTSVGVSEFLRSSSSVRVVASSCIPQGSMTFPIEPKALVGKSELAQISVNLNSFGAIDLDNSSKCAWDKNLHWIRALRFSDDCHSYNVQLKFQPSQRVHPNNIKQDRMPKMILQAIRSIEIGQELQLWFSEDVLAMLQIVFLSPSNIQGQKKYVCTRCSALYESPNPLKLHITLGCGNLPISTLWERLAFLLSGKESLRGTFKRTSFDFKLSLEPEIRNNALDLSTNAVTTAKTLYRPYYTESSAFKPFKKDANSVREFPRIWPIDFETNVVQIHQNLINSQNLAQHQITYNDDAQIETLVSSLGKAKQGHICLYCGKCYSRKYGLKIHIRTHTGYKPLKCKFCDRPFGDPSNLNKHVRLHAEGNTPYKCDLCGKILVRRRDLDRHLKSRHMVEMLPGSNIIPPDTLSEDAQVSDEDRQTTMEKENDNDPAT